MLPILPRTLPLALPAKESTVNTDLILLEIAQLIVCDTVVSSSINLKHHYIHKPPTKKITEKAAPVHRIGAQK